MAWNEKCRRDQCPNVDDALNIVKAHSAQHHSRIVSITRVQCFSCATSCKLIPFIICTGAVSQIWSIAIKINNRIEFLDFEFWWAKHREREKMVGLFEEKKTPTIQINILLWLLWFTLAWLRLINQLPVGSYLFQLTSSLSSNKLCVRRFPYLSREIFWQWERKDDCLTLLIRDENIRKQIDCMRPGVWRHMYFGWIHWPRGIYKEQNFFSHCFSSVACIENYVLTGRWIRAQNTL